MARTALAPIPITGPLVVPVGGQLSHLNGIKLGNESDQTLYWEWGDQSGYLYPSEVDVLRPSSQPSQAIRVTPTQVLPTGLGLTQQLLAEFAYAPDDFPGTWPQQMSRLVQRVTSPLQASQKVTDTGAGTFKVITPPPGTLAISLLIDSPQNVDAGNTQFVGTVSNVDYTKGGLSILSSIFNANQKLYRFLVEFDVDTSFNFLLKALAATTVNCWVSFLTDTSTVSISNAQIVQVSNSAAATPPQTTPTLNASQNVSINASASVTSIPAGNRFYLHGYSFGTDGANAAGRIRQLVGGTPILDMDANATRGQIAVGSHYGLIVAPTNAVTVDNQGAAASFVAINQDYATSL